MSKIVLLSPDPCRNKELEALSQYYLTLCNSYISTERIFFKSTKIQKPQPELIEQGLKKESLSILKHLKTNWYPILMTENAPSHSTEQLLSKFTGWLESKSTLCFIFGSAYGFHKTLKKEIPHHLAVSPMTHPHELALVIWVEQLYRLMTLQSGKRYHY